MYFIEFVVEYGKDHSRGCAIQKVNLSSTSPTEKRKISIGGRV